MRKWSCLVDTVGQVFLVVCHPEPRTIAKEEQHIAGMILETKNYVPWKKIHVPWKKYLQPLEKKFRLLWPCGHLVLWSSGPVVLWSCGPVVLCPLVLWSSGPLVLWFWSCGRVVLWPSGPLAKAWKETCRDQKSLEGMQKEVRKKKKRDN